MPRNTRCAPVHMSGSLQAQKLHVGNQGSEKSTRIVRDVAFVERHKMS